MARPVAVFDIDGVLADVAHRAHFVKNKPKNWKEFFAAAIDDEPLAEGFALLAELATDHDIVFLTGRPDHCRADTVTWLEAQGATAVALLMRPRGDFERSAVTKARLLAELTASGRDIAVVVDDDITVVDAYRAAGHNVIHATWGLPPEEFRRAQQIDGRA